MLRELHISDLGVIEDLDLQLHPGLNALTGETGAGKTMITVAVALALGQRSSSTVVRAGARAARVQALFDAPSGAEEWAEDAEGRRWRLSEQNRYDSAAQVNHITWRFEADDGRRLERQLRMRQFFPQELDGLFEYNGFEIVAKYGKYGEKPFHAESARQIIVARPGS